jgi:hypothetical protein
LAYADAARTYLKEHPLEAGISLPAPEEPQIVNFDDLASANSEPTAN